MTALVILNDEGQDTSLSVALYAAMRERDWQTNDEMPLVFIKEFSSYDTRQLRQANEKEVGEAVYEAEWKKVRFVYMVSEEKPVYGQSA